MYGNIKIAQFADWVWGLGTKTSFYLSQVQFDFYRVVPAVVGSKFYGFTKFNRCLMQWVPAAINQCVGAGHTVWQRRLSGPLHAELGAQIIPAQAGFKRDGHRNRVSGT